MNNIRFGKEKISIEIIGRQRFWFGVIAGIVTAISISLFLNYSREVFRLLSSLSADLLIFDKKELRFYNFFFSLLSTVLGLSITIWIWMNNHVHKRNKDRIYKQLSRTYALLVFWLILMIISRFGSVLPIILYGFPGYDNHLNLFEDFWLFFVLIPLVVFLQNWFAVRLVYRAGKWIFISFVVCVFSAFTLNFTTIVNQDKLNAIYFQRFEKEYQFIEQEIAYVKNKYGIVFEPQTIEALKKWHTENSINQVKSLKSAFSNSVSVTLDTIILQKIVIRNFKEGGWYYHPRNSIENWHYALPEDILKQINLTKSQNNKTFELFELLQYQIELINTPVIEWEKFENYSETERRRSYGAKYNIPKSLIFQLKEVRDSLLKIEEFADFAMELPKIKNKRIE